MKLLSRDEFREAVFARDGGLCVVCRKPAVDAHHLYDRKLWPDGGYYVEQGVSLCEDHHFQAEATDFSPTFLARLAHIPAPPMPPGFDPEKRYDKWGNEVLEGADGLAERKAGPLWDETIERLLHDHCVIHILIELPDGTCKLI